MKNKIIFISNMTTPQRAYENAPELRDYDVKFFSLSDSSQYIVENARDTEFLVIDAMGTVDDYVISNMPKLRAILSEGVGYQGVDMESAKRHGVVVINNKGINDTAVAEATVFLILGCLKNYPWGYKAVYEGRQMEAKSQSFGVVRELSQCTVGLVGFGDIAREAARMLGAFGTRVLYANRTRYEDLEEKYNVEYRELDDLLSEADFVSLHLPVNDDTRGIANEEFISKMKNDAYLINTARGDLVDNEALYNAIKSEKIAGAGLDVIFPEPVEKDNILLRDDIRDKLVLTPHNAGITSLTVKKLYQNIYQNIVRIINGEKPKNIVG